MVEFQILWCIGENCVFGVLPLSEAHVKLQGYYFSEDTFSLQVDIVLVKMGIIT